jgi:hypothetical protein
LNLKIVELNRSPGLCLRNIMFNLSNKNELFLQVVKLKRKNCQNNFCQTSVLNQSGIQIQFAQNLNFIEINLEFILGLYLLLSLINQTYKGKRISTCIILKIAF